MVVWKIALSSKGKASNEFLLKFSLLHHHISSPSFMSWFNTHIVVGMNQPSNKREVKVFSAEINSCELLFALTYGYDGLDNILVTFRLPQSV